MASTLCYICGVKLFLTDSKRLGRCDDHRDCQHRPFEDCMTCWACGNCDESCDQDDLCADCRAAGVKR